MVAISYLEAVEGPLWVAVRGKGLAYGSGFRRDPDGGFVQFSIYRSPDAYRAFVAAKDVLESYINGEAKFEQSALEGAISGIVVGFVVSTIDSLHSLVQTSAPFVQLELGHCELESVRVDVHFDGEN
jgi:Zn-dependent M16 (insulinase) family peptidase